MVVRSLRSLSNQITRSRTRRRPAPGAGLSSEISQDPSGVRTKICALALGPAWLAVRAGAALRVTNMAAISNVPGKRRRRDYNSPNAAS